MRPLLLAVALVACTAYPPPATGQTPRYVIFDQHVRNVLAKEWDAHAQDPVILERAYCLTYQKDLWVIPEYIWRVTEIEPAEVEGATPDGIERIYCPQGPNVTIAHLHPPASCISGSDCVPGGILAWQCFPSDVDTRTLVRSGAPFAVIICDRNTGIAYFPPAHTMANQAQKQ